ncbi:MAG: hypothetical protein QM731_24450 [Chitinophagaceae bacterium]
MRLRLLLLLLLTYTTVLARQKDTVLITPGSTLLETGKLDEYHLSYDLFSIKDGKEIKIGSLEDSFVLTTHNNKKAGLRICNIVFGANTILDSGLCYLADLKPVYHRSVQTKKRLHLLFDANEVNGFIIIPGDPAKEEQISYHAETPLFDSYYEDIIVKTLPYKTGLLFKFPEYIYERGGLVWTSGKVESKQTIQDPGGKTDTLWKIVLYEQNITGATTRETRYLINEEKRQIVFREYKMATGFIFMKPRSL